MACQPFGKCEDAESSRSMISSMLSSLVNPSRTHLSPEGKQCNPLRVKELSNRLTTVAPRGSGPAFAVGTTPIPAITAGRSLFPRSHTPSSDRSSCDFPALAPRCKGGWWGLPRSSVRRLRGCDSRCLSV